MTGLGRYALTESFSTGVHRGYNVRMTEKLQPPIDGSQVPDADAMAHDARYREVARVTIVGAILDLVLGIAKLFAGYFAYSQALIADGVHSLSDVATI